MISISESATELVVTGPADELEVLALEFRYRPDGYNFSERYRLYVLTEGKQGWDGWTYPFKILATNVAKCKRGFRDSVIKTAAESNIEIDTTKLLPRPLKHLTLDDIPPDIIKADYLLEESQRMAILQWLRHGIGLSHSSVGAGKTAMFAGAAAMVKKCHPNFRILYITQAERLVRQAMKDVTTFLPDFEITQFGGGKHDQDGKDMVIATAAMLNKHLKRLQSEGWFKTFGCVMYDEVQHSVSDSSQRILASIPAYYRFGATDSAREYKRVIQNEIIGLFGAFRHKIETGTLIKSGRLAKPHIYLVEIPGWHNKFADADFHAAPNTPAWVLLEGTWVKGTYMGPVPELGDDGEVLFTTKKKTDGVDPKTGKVRWRVEQIAVTKPGLHRISINDKEMEIESRWCLLHRLYDRAIIRFRERNELIVKWAKHYSDRKYPTLIVCTRTLHIYTLEALIKRTVDPELVRILFSVDSSAKRDETLQWLKETPGGVLITPLVKEGVSINEIRAGIVADYVADYDAAKQIIGRFIRRKDVDNRADVTWFCDTQSPTYRRGCNDLFHKLEQVNGLTFYHPCSTPESVQTQFAYSADDP